jgi:hypothetical protein
MPSLLYEIGKCNTLSTCCDESNEHTDDRAPFGATQGHMAVQSEEVSNVDTMESNGDTQRVGTIDDVNGG